MRELEEAFDVRVDIADTGVVSIYGPSQEAYKKAAARVLGVAGESVKVGLGGCLEAREGVLGARLVNRQPPPATPSSPTNRPASTATH